MKVLFDTWPCAFDCMGGGEIQLLNYKKILEQNGVEVLLYNKWKPQFAEADVVHLFSTYDDGVFTRYVRDVKKIPLVISPIFWPTKRQDVDVEVLANALGRHDRILANSQEEILFMRALLGWDEKKFTRVVNGVDDLFFERISPELFREKYGVKGPFLLNVGNIEPRKNQLLLIEAVKETGLDLYIIGSPRDDAYYRECLAAANQHIHFLGRIDNRDPLLRSAYAGAEAFLLPSWVETPGLSALEAAASGAKRIVATAIGCAEEYLGDLAEYVLPNARESILAGIEKALARPADDGSLGERIRQNFTWRHAGETLLEVYRSVLAEKKGAPEIHAAPGAHWSTNSRPAAATYTFDLNIPHIWGLKAPNFEYAHFSNDDDMAIPLTSQLHFSGSFIARIETTLIGMSSRSFLTFSLKDSGVEKREYLQRGKNCTEFAFEVPDGGAELEIVAHVHKGDLFFLHAGSVMLEENDPLSNFLAAAMNAWEKKIPAADAALLPLTQLLNNWSPINKTENFAVCHPDGAIIHGPYAQFEPGSYEIELEYSWKNMDTTASGDSRPHVDLCHDRGSQVLAGDTCAPGRNQTSLLSAEVARPLEGVEVRVFVPASCLFLLHGITIKRSSLADGARKE